MRRKNPYEETITERIQKQARSKFSNSAKFAGKEKYIVSEDFVMPNRSIISALKMPGWSTQDIFDWWIFSANLSAVEPEILYLTPAEATLRRLKGEMLIKIK